MPEIFGGGGGGSGSTSSGVTGNFTCPSNAAVGEAVYEATGVDTIGRANATSVATCPAIGFIKSKPTTTTCIVQYSGELAGFTGLTEGAQYYLHTTTGAITTTAPSGSGNVIQKLGRAKSTTKLEILIDQTLTIL